MEGLACADPGTRTPIGASGNWNPSLWSGGEKVGYEELKAAFQHHPEDFKLMEEKFKSTADSKARFAYLKGTIVEREKVEIDISSPDLEEGLFVCCTTFCYRNLPFARYSCPCCYSLLLSPTVLSRHLLTYILHNLTP